jgi:uncharacterized protein (TIGR02597 family)
MKACVAALLMPTVVLSLVLIAGAQTSSSPVASEIAGFTSFEVPGTTTPGTPQLSLKSIGLVRPIEYQGIAEKIRAVTLTDSEAVWTQDQFNPVKAKIGTSTHYVELTTGPLAGALFDILRTDAKRKTLTLAQVVPAKAGLKVGFRIREYWTLASLFGAANDIGLVAGAENEADQIWIYNGKSYDKYFYSLGEAGLGWRRVGGGTKDEASRKLYPDDGLIMIRGADSTASTLIKGVVKTDRMLIPVRRKYNLVANISQTPLTLSSSQLYTGNAATGLRAGATAVTADNVILHNGSGYDIYYYQKSVRNGTGWRLSSDPLSDVGAISIAQGGAFAIQRRGSKGFNWFTPAR